jgi:hypothetical protein
MPERPVDKLHIPYKSFATDRSTVIRDAFRKFVAPDAEEVTSEQLEAIADHLFKTQSQDHQTDWLELERWSSRLTDILSGPVPGPYPMGPLAHATYRYDGPSQTGSRGAMSAEYEYHYQTYTDFRRLGTDNPAVFGTGAPQIKMTGCYQLSCSWSFDYPVPMQHLSLYFGPPHFDHCGYQSWQVEYPRSGPTRYAGSGTAVQIIDELPDWYFFELVLPVQHSTDDDWQYGVTGGGWFEADLTRLATL